MNRPYGHIPYARNMADGRFWPPLIVWSSTRGWLNVRDPEDGTWFSIPAKGAPYGWTRLATEAKESHL